MIGVFLTVVQVGLLLAGVLVAVAWCARDLIRYWIGRDEG